MAVARAANNDSIRLIKDAADIVDVIGSFVPLKQKGLSYWGLCPFHQEKTPSFMVNRERRSFHCFGCGVGGDIFAFLMRHHQLTFPEAAQELAERYNIAFQVGKGDAGDGSAQKRELFYEINSWAAHLFHRQLVSEPVGQPARDYLRARGITAEMVETFQLGYAPDDWQFLAGSLAREKMSLADAQEAGVIIRNESGRWYDRFRNRIIFPIAGSTGRVLGFGGRIIGSGEPKYLNSPETPIFDKGRTLYGLYENKDTIRKERRCILVEGNFDLISLVSHGFRHAAAPLGTALTKAHVRTLKGYVEEAILLFDADAAGLKAALRAVPVFLAERVTAKIALLPPGEDPDSFVRRAGPEALAKSLAAALPLPEFVFEQLLRAHGLSLDGKARILEELVPLLDACKRNPMQHSLLVAHFSDRLGLEPEQIMTGLKQPVASRSAASKVQSAAITPHERRYLEFLLVFPEYWPLFLEAGLNDAVQSATGRRVLNLIASCEPPAATSSWETMLEDLSEEERAVVAELLTSAPVYADESKSGAAAEMMDRLRQLRLRKEKDALLEQLNQAYDAKDGKLVNELLRQKMAVDRLLIGDACE